MCAIDADQRPRLDLNLLDWCSTGAPRVRPGNSLSLTSAGLKAQGIWTPLTDEVEERWTDRFGPAAEDALRTALMDVVARLDMDPPDYLPVGEPAYRRAGYSRVMLDCR